MIDRFTKTEFENALPRDKDSKQPLWYYAGLRSGEHCYIVKIREGVMIFVRSSVREDGVAADSAKDSIRCWLAAHESGAPLGSKDRRWITRQPGWEHRLVELLRRLYRFGKALQKCKVCGNQMLAMKSKKPNSEGRWFTMCPQCREFAGWLEFPDNKPKPQAVSS